MINKPPIRDKTSKKSMRFRATKYNKRSQATKITEKTRKQVFKRDDYTCIIPNCYSRNIDPHHYILASKNGLAIPQNLVSLCREHHNMIHDNYTKSKYLTRLCKDHLDMLYPNFKDEDRVYKKYNFTKE